MATPHKQSIVTPTGRLVQGSLYIPQDTDAEGKPLVVKTGPNKGDATQRFFFALAVQKGPEKHWAETKLGALIWQTGHAAFPGGQAQRPDFAWKVKDGDSTIPNKRGKKPCDQEGFAGHWIFSFSSTYAPKVVNANGTAPILEPDAVKLGYYVQVLGTVDGNASDNQPGVYLNHSHVALQGYGPEIFVGPDPSTVGFGGGPAPAGMSTAPVAALPPSTTAAAATTGYVQAPAAYAPPPPPGPVVAAPAPYAPPVPGIPAPAPMVPPQTAVAPHPGILAPPAGVPAPMAPPPPPAGPQMTAKAGGVPYESFRAQGWTDEALRANGYMG